MNRPQAPEGLSHRPGKLIAIPAVAASLLVGGLPGHAGVAEAHSAKAGANPSHSAKARANPSHSAKARANPSHSAKPGKRLAKKSQKTTDNGPPAGGGAGRKIR
jgi:hypothetical protein